MSLISAREVLRLVLWTVLGVVAGASLIGLIQDWDSFVSNRDRCERALVQASGLVACSQHPSCQLSNEELQDLYVARKNVIVSCARSTAEIMIEDEHRAEEFAGD